MIPWSHYKQVYSSDFILIRHAVFMNFVNADANIIEEDLTPQNIIDLIQQVGKEYLKRNKRGLTENDIK